MVNLFKVFTPSLPLGENLNQILQSGQLTSGKNVREFETILQDYIGNPYIMVTGSNNYASLISLAICNLKNDDEVIASPMACLASNQPVLNFGAKLVWADIDPKTGSLDPVDVKRKITSKTKAIIHYHWGGYPGYLDEINAIGQEQGIPVIDDAIESFGSEYKGKKMGNAGTDITTFSFQTVRLPNSIDGGAIAFKSKELYDKAIKMRDFGITRSTFRDNLGEINAASNIAGMGYNAIMNELNSFIGIQVMQHVPALIQKQRENALIWNKYFQDKKVEMLNFRSEISPNYWIYSYLSPNQAADMAYFRKNELYASKVHLRNDHYSCFGLFDNGLMGVEHFAAHQLSVPCGWWVDSDDFISLNGAA